MLKLVQAVNTQPLQEKAADAAVGLSLAGAGTAWMSQANEVLTMCATLTAIVAACMAARYHYKKTKLMNDHEDSSKVDKILSEEDDA